MTRTVDRKFPKFPVRLRWSCSRVSFLSTAHSNNNFSSDALLSRNDLMKTKSLWPLGCSGRRKSLPSTDTSQSYCSSRQIPNHNLDSGASRGVIAWAGKLPPITSYMSLGRDQMSYGNKRCFYVWRRRSSNCIATVLMLSRLTLINI